MLLRTEREIGAGHIVPIDDNLVDCCAGEQLADFVKYHPLKHFSIPSRCQITRYQSVTAPRQRFGFGDLVEKSSFGYLIIGRGVDASVFGVLAHFAWRILLVHGVVAFLVVVVYRTPYEGGEARHHRVDGVVILPPTTPLLSQIP